VLDHSLTIAHQHRSPALFLTVLLAISLNTPDPQTGEAGPSSVPSASWFMYRAVWLATTAVLVGVYRRSKRGVIARERRSQRRAELDGEYQRIINRKRGPAMSSKRPS